MLVRALLIYSTFTVICGSHSNVSAIPCPTVYIYESFPVFADGLAPQNISIARAYGLQLPTPGIFATKAFSFGEILFNRLYRSTHCRVTQDPSEADLFLIPSLLNIRKIGGFSKICKSNALDRKTLLEALPHLTPATEHKHVLFIVKGKTAVREGTSCGWMRGSMFPNMQRFALSHSYRGSPWTKWLGPSPPVMDGKIVSVPYSSSFHWTREIGDNPPWKRFDDRPTLIHYIGKPHGLQAVLRAKIYADCQLLGPPLCLAETEFEDQKSLLQKRRSVFCLEPEGDSPYRKSVYDSIVNGCIPVLFSIDTDISSPYHWGSFHEKSRVLISEKSYLGNKTGLSSLAEIPSDKVRAMQASIAANAQRMQYSLDDMPGGDDAVEVLLKKAALRASGVSFSDLSD